MVELRRKWYTGKNGALGKFLNSMIELEKKWTFEKLGPTFVVAYLPTFVVIQLSTSVAMLTPTVVVTSRPTFIVILKCKFDIVLIPHQIILHAIKITSKPMLGFLMNLQ